jgi:hypothetical protein
LSPQAAYARRPATNIFSVLSPDHVTLRDHLQRGRRTNSSASTLKFFPQGKSQSYGSCVDSFRAFENKKGRSGNRRPSEEWLCSVPLMSKRTSSEKSRKTFRRDVGNAAVKATGGKIVTRNLCSAARCVHILVTKNTERT